MSPTLEVSHTEHVCGVKKVTLTNETGLGKWQQRGLPL